MVLGLLWLGLLLGGLNKPALDSIPGMIEIAPLDKFPLQPDFQEHQGGLCKGNCREGLGHRECEYKSDPMVPSDQPGQFILGNITRLSPTISPSYSHRECEYKSDPMVPSDQPGQFILGNITRRTMELSPEMEMRYIEVSKSLGFSDDHITITAPMADGRLSRGIKFLLCQWIQIQEIMTRLLIVTVHDHVMAQRIKDYSESMYNSNSKKA
ncbi:Neutrophil gelatinase-associated lipocalin [Fukomys damarensis]|uniref:Neutrophil gelatinase-associated lipocalin n=1 Tax=Fukomys damarensis TaxID=885580 RepID=A0A091E1J9_FUKDA|nr:Neutrophil gelatinase-associated lipocalin [Fukomys damarensis]